MDPNIPAYSGHDEFEKILTSWFADENFRFDNYKFEIDTIEVSASGDLAYVRGHSQITKNILNGTTQVNTKFIDIWKKINDKWKCV